MEECKLTSKIEEMKEELKDQEEFYNDSVKEYEFQIYSLNIEGKEKDKEIETWSQLYEEYFKKNEELKKENEKQQKEIEDIVEYHNKGNPSHKKLFCDKDGKGGHFMPTICGIGEALKTMISNWNHVKEELEKLKE